MADKCPRCGSGESERAPAHFWRRAIVIAVPRRCVQCGTLFMPRYALWLSGIGLGMALALVIGVVVEAPRVLSLFADGLYGQGAFQTLVKLVTLTCACWLAYLALATAWDILKHRSWHGPA